MGRGRLTSGTGLEDPNKVIKVLASDGKTGEQREIAYSGCRIIGNGSFGVVFQARLVHGVNDGEGASAGERGSQVSDSIAIKKVLQDKRFKVRVAMLTYRTVNCKSCASSNILTWST